MLRIGRGAFGHIESNAGVFGPLSRRAGRAFVGSWNEIRPAAAPLPGLPKCSVSVSEFTSAAAGTAAFGKDGNGLLPRRAVSGDFSAAPFAEGSSRVRATA